MKRFVVAVAIVVVMSTIGVGSASAAGGGASKETSPVGFVLSSASCGNLPAGTTVNGTGVEKAISTTRTGPDGVTTIENSTHAHGTATDQNGNAYVFNYSNQFRVSNTVADPATFTGVMNDSFSLAGRGPAKLTNGFLAVFTTDFDTLFAFQPNRSKGDPIDFTNGSAHCDPL
jgi:hypothetical protein